MQVIKYVNQRIIKMKEKTKAQTKNKFIQIRVTEDEFQIIKSVSKKLNKSVTDIIKEYFKELHKK